MRANRPPSREGRPARDPDVSVVIPTHNRSQSLRRILDALATQSSDVLRTEVVVVADGCTDDSVDALARQKWPLRLRVVELDGKGPAAARNAGAKVARGRVLIFLDDDVLPVAEFVAEHARAQRERAGVVIGRLAPDESAGVPGWWRWMEWQLDKQYRQIAAGKRPLDGRSLYSGNFSIPREVFQSSGGFDESLRRCEDTELGIRLARAGVAFSLNLAAAGSHSGHHDYPSWRKIAYEDGRWDGELAVTFRYPFAWEEIFAAYRRRNALVRVFASLTLGRAALFEGTLTVLGWTARLCRLLRLRPIEPRVYGGIYNLIYWQGVCDELGGAGVLRRYLKATA